MTHGYRKLAARRVELGLTQQVLADRVSLKQPDISRIEQDGWLPPPDVQQRLAEALQAPRDVLFAQPESDAA